jgi:type VII secretion protein EccB
MATKKDLIEAQGFSRRRLLSAFVGGAPGGKELEPAQPLRAVIAGVALSVMVIIGGVFYGILSPGLPNDWANNRLIVASDTGARYVSINGTLYPVLNTASARLLIPAAEYKVITTDQKALSGIAIGPTIGILGAPDTLPSPAALVGTGWSACEVNGSTSLTISPEATAKKDTGAIVASSEDSLYVVSGSTRWKIATDQTDFVLRVLGLATVSPINVDAQWLSLFAPGDDFAQITVAQAGSSISGTDVRIGDVIHQVGTPDDEVYLITEDAELAPLSAIARQLYAFTATDGLGSTIEVSTSQVSGLRTAQSVAGSPTWPTEKLTQSTSNTPPCALLDTTTGDATTVLAQRAGDTTTPLTPGVHLSVGAGALIRAGGPNSGLVSLVDESGTRYQIAGADADLLARLGYSEADVSAVPVAWTVYFVGGAVLDQSAARQNVAAADTTTGN